LFKIYGNNFCDRNRKKKAAAAAVDNHVMDGMVVGVGSGSTVVYVVERLIERVQTEHLKLIFIPSSFQSKQLISQGKLQLGDLDIYPEIDVTIDGADEIDHSLNLIKGGGGCQTQEKIIASNSKKFIIVADYRKKSQFLGEQWKKGVPVEVIPMAYVPLQKVIKERLHGDAVLRMAVNKAGPIVTDNGNFILDINFGVIKDPKTLNQQLLVLPGVVETGLFIGMVERAYFGQEDESVMILDKDGHTRIIGNK